ncbi:U3 small nucleolar RNA-associated protein 6 homolog [Pollicipes pollicipes]|uniref:U3 small nucleolar RNA-associated protein 6 homolog n=1 Tax=Pollicipes pollicipes TaxID=41117 RepID=UPI0018854E0C|nr:U3 small nucleolar RNA-associated protein 6 homolog [Pollicipes pollicipes]
MAEFVQKRLEESLPELEQLERVQLFTKEEVRSVIKKRKEFEYRLQRKRKAKEDFTRYIEYERSLLQLIWKRRQRLGYKHKQADIDHKIVTRISQLYRIACIRFSDDVSLFLAHVAFCRQMRQLAQGSRVFTRLLRTHGHRPDVWEAAALYEMDDNNSPETARQLMLRALRLHPESTALWTAHFRLELGYAALLRRRQNLLGVTTKPEKATEPEEAGEKSGQAPADPVLEGAVARAVARQAVRRLPEVDPKADPCRLLTGLLAVCREFDFAAGLERELRDELRASFPQRALTYDTLARAALQGDRAPTKLRHRLRACCELYEHGLEAAAPADELYELYLSSLVETARAAARHRHLVLPRLEEVLGRAAAAGAVSESAFLGVAALYAELGMADQAAATLRTATDAHPASAALWWKLVQALADSGDECSPRTTCDRR